MLNKNTIIDIEINRQIVRYKITHVDYENKLYRLKRVLLLSNILDDLSISTKPIFILSDTELSELKFIVIKN